MVTRKRIKFQEREVVGAWQQLLGEELLTEGGERVCVVYPGRAGNASGPDFRDAAILVNGSKLVKGDVEIHVISSSWYRHGHHCDPGYNGVILHVVLWNDGSGHTFTANGKFVPLICLSKSLRCQAQLMPYHQLPCSHLKRNGQVLRERLRRAGEERFRQKAELFHSRLLRGDGRQVLFQGIMRALGYARNKGPFEELARRSPLDLLEGKLKGSLLLKEAWLLGMAGLLPSQRAQRQFLSEEWVKELENVWHSFREDETMKESDWCLSQIYPNNSPVRRIVAQSHLVQRYQGRGLLPSLMEMVAGAPLAKEAHWLEEGLVVAGEGHWRDRFDFALSARHRKSALLGRGKAGEVVVNVILPFAFSWGRAQGEKKLSRKAIMIYGDYPHLAENEITVHMAQQLSLVDTSNFTACHQQGLIRLFQDYCSQARCSECPLIRA